MQQLKKNNIPVITSPINELQHTSGSVRQLLCENGTAYDIEAVYAKPSFEQESNIPTSLGCEVSKNGLIQVDPFRKTTVPGVYACGDNSSPLRSIAYAVATGNIAGASVNMELANDLF